MLKEVNDLFPEIHSATAHLYDLIARSYIRFGHFKKAEKMLRKQLAIQKQIYPGERRFYLAWAQIGVSMVLRHMKKYSEALRHLRRAKEMFKVLFGRNNVMYYRTLAEIADVLRRQGRYKKSDVLLSKALELARVNPKMNAVSNKYIRLLMAKLRLDQGRPTEALSLLGKIPTNEDHHPNQLKDKHLLQNILVERARIFTYLGDIKQAKIAYSKSIDLGDQVSLLGGIHWPQLLSEYARFLVNHNDPEAQFTVKRALKTNRKFYGETSPHLRKQLAVINTN